MSELSCLCRADMKVAWYWLHPLLELSAAFLLPGIVIAVFTQRCPFCKKFLGIMFFSGKKEFCPYCGAEFEASTQSEQKS